MPTVYYQNNATVSLVNQASGDDYRLVLWDNSAVTSGEVVKIHKLTFEGFWDMASDVAPIVAVTRELNGVTAPTLDSQTAIRNLRNDKHLLRGPWLMLTKHLGQNYKLKTIVLKSVVLDEDDDLSFCLTWLNAATTGADENLRYQVKAFYRVLS